MEITIQKPKTKFSNNKPDKDRKLIRCPLGGQCFNPICAVFGCINN